MTRSESSGKEQLVPRPRPKFPSKRLTSRARNDIKLPLLSISRTHEPLLSEPRNLAIYNVHMFFIRNRLQIPLPRRQPPTTRTPLRNEPLFELVHLRFITQFCQHTLTHHLLRIYIDFRASQKHREGGQDPCFEFLAVAEEEIWIRAETLFFCFDVVVFAGCGGLLAVGGGGLDV